MGLFLDLILHYHTETYFIYAGVCKQIQEIFQEFIRAFQDIRWLLIQAQEYNENLIRLAYHYHTDSEKVQRFMSQRLTLNEEFVSSIDLKAHTRDNVYMIKKLVKTSKYTLLTEYTQIHVEDQEVDKECESDNDVMNE